MRPIIRLSGETTASVSATSVELSSARSRGASPTISSPSLWAKRSSPAGSASRMMMSPAITSVARLVRRMRLRARISPAMRTSQASATSSSSATDRPTALAPSTTLTSVT